MKGHSKVQGTDLTCHVTRNSLRLCCVDQSGTSFQILPEPRDMCFIKLRHSMQVHIIRMRVLFEGGPYMRKYGMYSNDQTDQLLRINYNMLLHTYLVCVCLFAFLIKMTKSV